MPDWCANRLTVSGAPERVAEFARAADDGERVLSFDRIRPVPAGLPEASVPDRDGMAQLLGLAEPTSRHTWRIRNWGCKWSPSPDAVIDDDPDPGRRVYRFSTPWSAPVPLVLHAAEQNPDLGFELVWYEPSSGEAGQLRAEGGTLVGTEEAAGDLSGWLGERGLEDWIGEPV